MNGNGNVEAVATAIHEAYDAYQSRFRAITRRASERFVRREWREAQRDASERIVLYKHRVDEVLAQTRAMLGDCVTDVATWEEIKWMHGALIAERADCEIAESFFNSVTRRIFSTVGVNPLVEYVFPDNEPGDIDDGPPVTRRYAWRGDTADVVRRMLHDLSWDARWRDMDGDAERVAERIDAELLTVRGSLASTRSRCSRRRSFATRARISWVACCAPTITSRCPCSSRCSTVATASTWMPCC